MTLSGTSAITVTVTSADGTRMRVYRVAFERPEVELVLSPTWTALEWPGVGGDAVGVALRKAGLAHTVAAIYRRDEVAQTWLAFFPGFEGVPGLNSLATFEQGRTYWIAVTERVTWTVLPKAGLATGAAAP